LASEYFHLLKIHTKFQSEFIRVGGCAEFASNSERKEKYQSDLLKELEIAIPDFLKQYSFNEIFNFINLEKLENIKEIAQIINIVISNNKSILCLTHTENYLIEFANKWLEKRKYDETIKITKSQSKTLTNSKLNLNNLQFEKELSFIPPPKKTKAPEKRNNFKKNLAAKIGKKIESNKDKTASIVLLSYNNKKYVEECLNSIIKHTKQPYEVIIVDNASDDKTVKFLKSFSSKNRNIKLILNKKNLGFPAGNNIGITKSEGDFIVLINNDIVVTKNWLDRILEIAEQYPEVGIIGPISNSVSGRQLDKNAKYKSIPEMHKYAAKIKQKNKGQFFQFPRVAFLCTLIKKEVIDKIGGLDERYSPGNFEDDDFCLRAQMAGYKTVIATDVFIHHYGSVSFKADGEDKYAKRISTNKQKFVEKWSADPEEIWIKGSKPKQREIKYPINNDLFIQHIERAFTNIEENEAFLAIENLEIAVNNFKNSERKGYENLVLDELLVILGNLYVATNNLEKAKEAFESALNENPTSSTACQGLGEIFEAIEEYEPAKMMFEWAVKNDKKNDVATNKLRTLNKSLGLDEYDISLSNQ
jgi:GT2 family glycosyltransferase